MFSLAGYQILTQLYDSANSAVYRALRHSDALPVILKVLKPDYPTPAELTRYQQEYELTRTLNIEGVVKTYGLEKHQNSLVIILEDFGGESLKILTKTQPLSLTEFLSIAIKITTGLEQIHAANLIHKDINPSNLVYGPATGQLKIIDFGISTRLTRETPTLKNPNVLEGTLAYISPEQTGRMNRSLDYRTDFYSLGVTFYELLTNQLPFATDDDLELIHCHLAKPPLSPAELNPAIPHALSDLVMKLMAKNAEDRYQSAFGLKYDLEQLLANQNSNLTGLTDLSGFQLAQQDISSKFLIPQKLYGRENVVAPLFTAFDQIVQGPSQLLLVAGYSGIGKTAVVQEIYKPITQKRGYFMAGKFDQFQRNVPYSAVVQAFRDLVQQLLTETQSRLDEWKTHILTAVGNNGQVIIDVIPEVELILGPQPTVPTLPPTESQNRFNLVFQNFITVFCQADHPLVIFLDDLQWIDSASLKLMTLMISDIRYLLLIGAYRDNEVSPVHPLMTTVAKMQKQGLLVQTLTLSPLTLAHLNQLVSDTLHLPLTDTIELTELVLEKTGGNPFFVSEFLKTLYTEQLLEFNLQKHQWQWDLDHIKARNITDNVVELMTGKIQRLFLPTQNLLKLAASVGNQFDLATLSVISQRSSDSVKTDLWEALVTGLVISRVEKYKFVHDRVQQAAYSLIPEEERPALHWQIGQLLLSSSTPGLEERLFEMVDHLNVGRTLATPQEQIQLAQLNLKAGRKARNATAYAAAMVYLQTGIELLEENCWQHQYELTLNLQVSATEVAYLNTDFDGMDKIATQVLQHAQHILDKVKVYEIQIIALTAQSKMLEAIAVGREALGQLGVELPTEFDQAKVDHALQTLANQLQGRWIEELIDLPVMTDPEKQAAMQLLGMLFAPILLGGIPELLPLFSSMMVSLSLQFGNTSASSMGYALHGMALCAFFGEGKTGYDFGKLALNLLERFNAQGFKSTIHNLFGAFIQHHRDAIRATIPTLKAGYQAGMETGDFLSAGYNISNFSYINFFGGLELNTLRIELAAYSSALAQSKQYSAQNYMDTTRQAVENLREDTVNQPDCLIGTAYDETVMLIKYHQDNELCAIAYTYIHKLLLAYSFSNYTAALDYFAKAKQHLVAVSGTVHVPIFHFYAALTHLALYPTKPTTEQAEMLAQAEIHQTTLHHLAQNAPMNYWHKWLLVEAEKQRVLGHKAEAIELYDRAIAEAKTNQFVNEEALANELAAQFYFNWGKAKIAQDYWREAHYAYTLWGALAKVKDLEQKYPQFLTVTATPPRLKGTTVATRLSTGHDSGATLDLATVMKANQAISGEIILEKLLVALMNIIIQNAGAQIGYLILVNQGKLVIEASGTIDSGNEVKPDRSVRPVRFGDDLDSEPVTGLHALPLENCQSLSQMIVNYVARTKTSVVLENATKTGQFTHDAYIKQQQPKSILCVPLINQGQLVSIVYLENNLATGAFTAERVEILNLLSSQAAISIKNAQLYHHTVALNRAYERFVPRQFLHFLEKTSIIDVELGDQVQLEMSVLFSDIRDFTTLSEKMTPRDNFQFINAYLSRMEAAILENHGFIDKYIGDAVMALFSGSADEAVNAGLAMLQQLQVYNQERVTAGETPIKIGIGINTGNLMLGTVGGQHRMDTTVISDAVNLASRVESLTKNYGVSLLITQHTYARLLNPSHYVIRPMDTVKVKGKSELVTVYEVR